MSNSRWKTGARVCSIWGSECWVENLDQVLESHRKATITSYGTRRSSKAAACSNKENNKPQNDSKMNVWQYSYLLKTALFLVLCTYQCYVPPSIPSYGQRQRQGLDQIVLTVRIWFDVSNNCGNIGYVCVTFQVISHFHQGDLIKGDIYWNKLVKLPPYTTACIGGWK